MNKNCIIILLRISVVDCEVSKWSEWGRCDAMCGKGKQTRKRIITRHPSPGGARCGQLEQKRNCLGTRCSRRYLRYKNPIRGESETKGSATIATIYGAALTLICYMGPYLNDVFEIFRDFGPPPPLSAF